MNQNDFPLCLSAPLGCQRESQAVVLYSALLWNPVRLMNLGSLEICIIYIDDLLFKVFYKVRK